MKRIILLKWFLKLSAISQIGYWGFSHLFFPGWYLRSIGLNELAANPGSSLLFIHEIGILTLGIGIATWLAANDPIKNIAIIVMLYVVSLGSIATSLFHIFYHKVAAGEWTTVMIISVQVVILTVLYPWRELRKRI
jgi:hypothetical protein